jgi:hypothetical protein
MTDTFRKPPDSHTRIPPERERQILYPRPFRFDKHDGQTSSMSQHLKLQGNVGVGYGNEGPYGVPLTVYQNDTTPTCSS